MVQQRVRRVNSTYIYTYILQTTREFGTLMPTTDDIKNVLMCTRSCFFAFHGVPVPTAVHHYTNMYIRALRETAQSKYVHERDVSGDTVLLYVVYNRYTLGIRVMVIFSGKRMGHWVRFLEDNSDVLPLTHISYVRTYICFYLYEWFMVHQT